MKKPAKFVFFNSIVTIVLCLALASGATFALFTSATSVNIAVTSGAVNVTATPTLTEASSALWDESAGAYTYPLREIHGNSSAEFANGGTAKVVGNRVDLAKITPGDSATIKIEISNNSTTAIKYQFTARFDNNEGLLDILDISLTSDDNSDLQIFDGQYTHTGADDSPDKLSKWQTLSAPAMAGTRTVANLYLKITFPMIYSLETDAYSGKTKASISLAINAVQGNSNTTDPTAPEHEEVNPDHTTVTVSSAQDGEYKILEAAAVPGHEFLYWAFRPAASSYAMRIATNTEFGKYLTNNPVYKFRVTPQTYGTYHAVYRVSTDNSSVVRLTKASPIYTVPDSAVGSNITLIAEEDVWYTFDYFIRGESERISADAQSMYTFTADAAGDTYMAHYREIDLSEYFDYYDNSGVLNYSAKIVNPNVARPQDVEVGAGGINGGAGQGLAAYPLYGKGYTDPKFTGSQYSKNLSEYNVLNKAVYAETEEIVAIGSSGRGLNYFMDSDGYLYESRDMLYGMTEDEMAQYYDDMTALFCKEHDIFDSVVGSDGKVDTAKFLAKLDEDPQIDDEYRDYIAKVMGSGLAWIVVGHLYKHLEAENMYFGNISADQPAVEKVISDTARGTSQGWSPTITGLYAPAGEVITLKLSQADMERTGGMIVSIGMVTMNGREFGFSDSRYPNRPAHITTQFTFTADTQHPDFVQTVDEEGNYTFYFGSYVGGPIYVSPINPGTSFTVDISGGVEYQHYIYGYTTEEEFESRSGSTAPYFDCWVTSEDVRFSGPKSQVNGLTYENFVKVSRLWENVARISKSFPSQSNSEYGVQFMFETYVRVGAACAFAESNTVDAPYGWMGGALSYESIVEYGGWGNFHEFNHCYQFFGIGADVEVSNNTVNLVEYALFTEISAHRDVDANGISTRYKGWESYTDPAFALRVLIGGNPADGSRDKNLCRYVNLFYAFGLERYIEITQQTSHNGGTIRGGGSLPLFNAASQVTGYNMEYYFNEILFPLDDETYKSYHIADANCVYDDMPMFVPIACTYQTGVGYAFDRETGKGANALTDPNGIQWEYTTTSRPFRIDFSSPFKLDFEHTLAIPKDFSWEIELTSKPAFGEITKADLRNFTYTPNAAARAAMTSGSMIFTVNYKGIDGTAAKGIVGSVQLVVQFDASSTSKVLSTVLDRTVYTFAEDMVESDGGEVAAIDEPLSKFETERSAWSYSFNHNPENYDGTFNGAMYETVEANVLPQSAGQQNNTAVYFDEAHPMPADSFITVSGIIDITDEWKGQSFYLGIECSTGYGALYLSTDGVHYTLFVAATMNMDVNGVVFAMDVNGYQVAKLYTVGDDVTHLYFREVLAVDSTASDNHINMIWGESSAINDVNSWYVNNTGTFMNWDTLSDKAISPNDPNHTGCAYCEKDPVTESYELEYLEVRNRYVNENTQATQTEVSVSGGTIEEKWDDSIGAAPVSKDFFFDGDPRTPFIVSGIGSRGQVLTVVGMMSEPVTADSFTLRSDADNAPRSYKLYVSDTQEFTESDLVYSQEWNVYGSRPRLQRLGTLEQLFDGGERTFQYYKLVVSAVSGTHNKLNVGNVTWLILYGIDFGMRWNLKQPSDRDVEKLGDWDNVRTDGSTFGHLLTANGASGSEPFCSLSMSFEGTQLRIRALADKAYGVVEVVIDGEVVAVVDLRNFGDGGLREGEFQTIFALDDLDDGSHTLVLRSTEAFNVDAILYR